MEPLPGHLSDHSGPEAPRKDCTPNVRPHSLQPALSGKRREYVLHKITGVSALRDLLAFFVCSAGSSSTLF
jgi:hypothetical protein